MNDLLATLSAYLDAQRQHVLGIVEGLDEEQLRRTVLPSGWSCATMLSHLAIEVEDFWFTAVMSGAGTDWQNAPNAWEVPDDVPASDWIDRYRAAIARSEAVVAGLAVDTEPPWWPGDLFGQFRLGDLGEVLLHVTVETACHAGHLDAVREQIDGRQWMVLTD